MNQGSENKYLAIMATLCLAVYLLLSAGSFAQPWADFLPLPHISAAATDDALATLSNPAGLGVISGWSLHALAPYHRGAQFGNWGFAAGGYRLGFTGEIIHRDSDQIHPRSRYTMGMGLGGSGVYFGLSYSWTKHLDRENQWDAGILLRPYRFLSFAAVARALNNPVVDGWRRHIGYDLGLALRPLALLLPRGGSGERLTLAFDAALRKIDIPSLSAIAGPIILKDYLDDLAYKLGVDILIVRGLTGHLNYENSRPIWEGIRFHQGDWGFRRHEQDARLWAGVTFNFARSEIGGVQLEGEGRGTAWAALRELRRESIFHRRQRRFVEVELTGRILEYRRYSPLFRRGRRTIYDFQKQLNRYSADPDVAGIILKCGEIEAGWGKLREIRAMIQGFRDAGKGVICFFESCGNREYYLASAADHIFMPPAGSLRLTGLAAHMVFLKETFDKIGIDAEIAHVGEYKTAGDQFTRDGMSDAQREQIEALLDDIHRSFTIAIANGRGMDSSYVHELIDAGPFTASAAFEKGLVDSLVYEDQLEDMVKEFFPDNPDPVLISERRQDRIHDDRREWDDARRKSIAVIYGVGEITTGASRESGLFSDETMGSATIARAIREAREDDGVAAIVFRIDSPGGSALGSELIWREVQRCVEGDDPKPFIASMSDLAASGGYYIASMADTIIAQPTTITGSIGIVGGKFAYHRLQRKLGINTATITRGKFADFGAGWRSFTDEEWQKLNADLRHNYDIFIQRVASGRGMDSSAVGALAEGRVWSGGQAVDSGLVDLIGGLEFAIHIAADAGGIRDGETFKIRTYPEPRDFDIAGEFQAVVKASLPKSLRKLGGKLTAADRFQGREMLYLMPYSVDIR